MRPILFLFALSALAAVQSIETFVDDARVRVIKVTVPVDHATGMHEHKINRVMLYLQEGGQKVIHADGREVIQQWAAGQPLWSPAVGMHRVELIADEPQSIVEIELNQPGPADPPELGPLDPLAVDPGHYRVIFENDQVRVIHVEIGPGESAPMHEHLRARAVTYLTAAHFEATSEDGRTAISHQQAGDVVWSDSLIRHREINRGSNVFKGVVVELK